MEVFGVTNGPSYRFTIDMNDLDGARIIITTGQSGNPGDPHYGDLIPLWAEGETIPLPFSAGNVQASAAQTLTLGATVDAHHVRAGGAGSLFGGGLHSLTGSGPSGTSIRTRPSSITTG